jgi:hypothetical protein
MYFPLFSVKSIHNVSCTAKKRFGMGQAHIGSLSFRVGAARYYGFMARGGSELVADEGPRNPLFAVSFEGVVVVVVVSEQRNEIERGGSKAV